MNSEDSLRQLYNQFYKTRVAAAAPKLKKIIDAQYKYATDTGDYNNLPTQELFDFLKKLYKDAARVWGNRIRLSINIEKVNKRLGTIGYNERLMQLIEEYFRLYLFQDVTQINDTTREELLKIFTQGFKDGLNLFEIQKQIEALGMSGIRAERIARTEVTTAANRGGLIAAQATGLNLRKKWLATKDKRTRDTHRLVDGQEVAFDEPFSVNGVLMDVPGDRGGKDGRPKTPAKEVVNCRCTCLFIPIE